MGLSRTKVERLTANAVRPEEAYTDLPKLADKILMRRPSNTDRVDALTGVTDDRDGVKLVATLWIMAIDDESGDRLFDSREQAAAWLNTLDPSDMEALVNGIDALINDKDPEPEDAEAGKDS